MVDGDTAYPVPMNRNETAETGIPPTGELWLSPTGVGQPFDEINVWKLHSIIFGLTIQIFGEGYTGSPITSFGGSIRVTMPHALVNQRWWIRVTGMVEGERLAAAWLR